MCSSNFVAATRIAPISSSSGNARGPSGSLRRDGQDAHAQAQERRQQDEVGEVRQVAHVGGHPADAQQLGVQAEEARQKELRFRTAQQRARPGGAHWRALDRSRLQHVRVIGADRIHASLDQAPQHARIGADPRRDRQAFLVRALDILRRHVRPVRQHRVGVSLRAQVRHRRRRGGPRTARPSPRVRPGT